MHDLILRSVDEALQTALSTLAAKVEIENNKRYNELLQTIDTALTNIGVTNENLQDIQDLATAGNVYGTDDLTQFKVGTVQGIGAGGATGSWTQLITATTSTYKTRINKINYILDIPAVPAYMPATYAYYIAIKEAGFSFSAGSPTNFTDINTSCYLSVLPRVNAGAPGTGQVYPHAGDNLIGVPAGAAPPESSIKTAQKLRISLTPNKALPSGGLSVWGWQVPLAGLTTETMACTLEYTIQNGGTL